MFEGRLKRALGLVEVFSIASGAMISSGLFILPAVVYDKAGPAIILAYLLAAILVIPALLSKTELATAMPKSGGAYFFIQRSLGSLLGTFSGLAAWFSLSLKSAFALVGIGVLISPLLPTLPVGTAKLIAVAFTLMFTILNILSVKESGKFQVILVFTLLSLLAYYLVGGLNRLDVHRYVPFSPGGWTAVLAATGMIFVSYGGLTKVASIAEEIKDPSRTIPRGMISSYLVVTVFYLLTIFVTVGLLDGDAFRTTMMPLSLGASQFSGRPGFILLAAAAMMAFVTTGNAGLLASSRNLMAMAKDNLIPPVLGKVNLRFKTPVISILMTAAFMILVIVLLDLEDLVKVASTMKLLLFALANVSVIVMRESRIVSYRPSFRGPLYPFLQIAGTALYLFLIVEMGLIPLLITLAFFVFSLLWYLIYSRTRNQKDSALIHLVDRLTSRRIRTSGLEEELRDILRERDQITEDRFDQLIKEAEIIDVAALDREGLFQLLADTLAQKFSASPQELNTLLHEREAESTTAIHDGLAIPHIVVEGTSAFEIVVVRSREGINYGPDILPVHIVFALAGSKKERNFHLQALMAIAQIVQNNEFLSNWNKARGSEDLRNLILLSERIRKGQI